MTELTYTKNGDYLIPDLTLSETPEDARPPHPFHLVAGFQLLRHARRLHQLRHHLLQSPIRRLVGVGLMNSLKAQAEEIILSELVYN